MSTQRMFLRSVGTPFWAAGMRAGLVILTVLASLLLSLTRTASAQSVPGYTVTTFATGIAGARGISTDAADNVYTLGRDDGKVYKISPAGAVTVIADLPDLHRIGPHFDRVSGNLFISDANFNSAVLKITPAGVVSVYATGLPAPADITSDAAGNLYVSNWQPVGTVSRVTPSGAVSQFATGLSLPDGLVFGPGGDLFIGNRGTNQIKRVPAAGGTATVFASGFNLPLGITYDGQGNLFVANFGNGVLSKVSPTGAVSTFGTGFSNPLGLAFDSNGNLFVANFGNGTIIKISAVSPLLANGSFESPGGAGKVASSQNPPPSGFVSNTYITGWEVYTGDIDYLNSSLSGWTASDGNMSLDLVGFNSGGIRQTIATVPGETYIVTFDMAANPSGTNPKTLRVSAGASNALFTFNWTGKTGTNMGWETKTWSFVANSTSTVLSFENAGSSQGFAGPALDNVRVVKSANRPPVANAGADQTVECTSPSGASVTLNGTGSSDPDGDALTYSWSGSFGTASGPTPTVTLPLGTHTITLTVNDGKGGTATDQVVVTVQDTTPPTISLTVSPTSLWPPNHKMVKVATGISATDACDPSPALSIGVTSNEPVNGLGDGDTAPDWEVVNDEVSVRAERSGKGNGRIYTITVTATDASGNTATSTKTVTVVHDKGKSSKPVAEEPAPEAFGLEQSYPNPFNPATTIRYALPEAANVTLVVYNLLGQQVRTLVNGAQGPGYHSVVWDGRDEAGRLAATGMYIYRLQAGAFSQVKKMLFAK